MPQISEQYLEIIAWSALALGAAFFIWGWWFFEEKSERRRCPRCWYDMSGTPGMRCSECGREVASERKLFKRRRGWGRVTTAIVLACITMSILVRTVALRGWAAVPPTWSILLVLPRVEYDFNLLDELDKRRSVGRMGDRSERWLGSILQDKIIDAWPDVNTGHQQELNQTFGAKRDRRLDLIDDLFERLADAGTTREKAGILRAIGDRVAWFGSRTPTDHVQTLKSLAENEPELRFEAASAMAMFEGPALPELPFIIDILDRGGDDPDAIARLIGAVRFLTQQLGLELDDVVIQYALGDHKSSNDVTRRMALQSVWSPASSLQTVQQVWETALAEIDADPKFRAWLFENAARHVSNRTALLRGLADDDCSVRVAAILAVEDFDSRAGGRVVPAWTDEHLDLVETVLRQPLEDENLRVLAFDILPRNARTVALARDLADDASTVVAERAAEFALNWQARLPRNPTFTELIDAAAHEDMGMRFGFARFVESRENSIARFEAVQIRQIMTALRALLDDPEPQVRQAAEQAAKRYPLLIQDASDSEDDR